MLIGQRVDRRFFSLAFFVGHGYTFVSIIDELKKACLFLPTERECHVFGYSSVDLCD
jgi:hypothetical protein